MNIQEFKDEFTVRGPVDAFFQSGYADDIFGEVDKMQDCEFCHSRYNPNNLRRKRRHESGACQQ